MSRRRSATAHDRGDGATARAVGGLDLSSILGQAVDFRYKGFPPTDGAVTVGTIGAQRWNARAGDLLLPLIVLKERALAHNIELMARYCRTHGLSLAPHGKTPMAPQLVDRQLGAGAWAVTAATVHQARVFRAFGCGRILIANEVVEPAAARWLAAELARDPRFECFVLVDSEAGVGALTRALEPDAPSRRLPVLVEIGAPGGRAGCRTGAEAAAVARAVCRSARLELAGVEAYEGAVPASAAADRVDAVNRFLRGVRATAETLIAQDVFAGRREIIVSAGSSLFVDRVAELWALPWAAAAPVRVVVRCGAYVAHDVDEYAHLSPFAGRGAGPDRMLPALELLAVVLSRPEPELAIVGFGKRDAPYDVRLPVPTWVWRDGSGRAIGDGAAVTALNDQHAFVRLPAGADLRVGEVVGFDVSHPCTTFDKWRLVPLVDDAYTVTGGILTFF